MEEEREEAPPPLLLVLFDLYWFHRQILCHSPPPPPPPPSPPREEEVVVAPRVAQPQTQPFVPRHRRSLSDEVARLPALQIDRPQPKLQTILSGKEAAVAEEFFRLREEERSGRIEEEEEEEEEMGSQRKVKKRRKKKKGSRSLPDLEFEELRGLMDLGFDFSDAEADPRLMSIVPALRRRNGVSPPPVSGDGAESGVSRPYLSEAWDAEEEDPLNNWRIPVAAAGVDMKDHLKFWAHMVASTVR